MKKLWTGTDLVQLTMLKSELEAKGIEFTVKNEALRGAVGELPWNDIWPEVWIADDADLKAAEEVLADLTAMGERE